MAIYGAFTNCGIFLDSLDMKSRTNMVKLAASKEVKDRSVFGNLGRVREATGLADVQLTAAGFHDNAAAAQDVKFRANWGTADILTTFMIPATSGATVAVGDKAWFFKGTQPQYTTGGVQGEDLMWDLNLQGGYGGYGPIFGSVLDPGIVAKTADGNGVTFELGAVAAGQYLYAIFHVTSLTAADSVVLKIESDDVANFGGTPEYQITSSSFAAVGAQLAVRVAGPITDTFYRAVWDVTDAGGGVSTVIAVAAGIQ
jgi:hypothetical protein